MPEKKRSVIGSEMVSECGLLLVIAGGSGTGKDRIVDGVLAHPFFKQLGFKRLITCADRKPRKGEVHGVHYHFISTEEMDAKSNNHEFVEIPVATGTSRKATLRKEFTQIFEEKVNLLWRIDPSKSAEVASGKFFEEQFPEMVDLFKRNTIVCCIKASPEEIAKRRKARDGEKYDENEYRMRDQQEAPHLAILEQHAHLIYNADGKHEEAVSEIFTLVSQHFSSKKAK